MTSRLRPAQHVVHDEQPPGVGAVGEVARADRADDVEHADQRQVAGGRRRRDVVVVRRRHEVGLDQPVRRQPAHEEAAEQQPERAAVPGVAEGAERGADRLGCRGLTRRSACPRSRRRGAGPCPRDGRAGTSTTIGIDREGADGDRHAHPAPPDALGQPRQQGQEHELPARRRRGQGAGDEAAPGDEPAAGHGRGEHRRHAARAEADDDAPQQEQLPRLGHPGRAERTERDRDERHDGDPAQAVAGLQRRGERSDEAEQQHVDADGRADRGPAPAELLAQRVDQDPRRRAEPGRAEQRDERRREDDPRVVDPGATRTGRRTYRRRALGAPSRSRRSLASSRSDRARPDPASGHCVPRRRWARSATSSRTSGGSSTSNGNGRLAR